MKEELLNALYCEFINRVNEVGVDVNRAIAHPYSQALLQYVCGLGPRKGTHLLKVRMEWASAAPRADSALNQSYCVQVSILAALLRGPVSRACTLGVSDSTVPTWPGVCVVALLAHLELCMGQAPRCG